jgi:phospholipase D1/2
MGSVRRRRRATTKGSRRGFTIEDMPSRADAEELMNMTQGHLVQFPYDWLLTEEHNGNWGYQVDGVAPLVI